MSLISTSNSERLRSARFAPSPALGLEDRATEAVGIKLVTSNGRNLIVTIILTGECGLSLLYSER